MEFAKEKIKQFLYRLFCPEKMVLTFASYLNVLFIKYTFRIYILLRIAKDCSYTFLIVFKIMQSLQCILSVGHLTHLVLRTSLLSATWKVSVFGVILVGIFPHLDWITPNTDTFYSTVVTIFVNIVAIFQMQNLW